MKTGAPEPIVGENRRSRGAPEPIVGENPRSRGAPEALPSQSSGKTGAPEALCSARLGSAWPLWPGGCGLAAVAWPLHRHQNEIDNLSVHILHIQRHFVFCPCSTYGHSGYFGMGSLVHNHASETHTMVP